MDTHKDPTAERSRCPGAEQAYTMSDALAVAAYLNIFIRTGTEIACLAQVRSKVPHDPNSFV